MCYIILQQKLLAKLASRNFIQNSLNIHDTWLKTGHKNTHALTKEIIKPFTETCVVEGKNFNSPRFLNVCYLVRSPQSRAFLSNFSRESKISAAGRRAGEIRVDDSKDLSLEMAIRILMRVCHPIPLSRRGTNAVCQAACKTFCKTLCPAIRDASVWLQRRACQVSNNRTDFISF